MTAVQICFNQQELSLVPGQSLLEAALDNQLAIPNSCRSGVCQTCLIKVKDGKIPPEAQKGLSENQVQQNLALACQLRPTEAITVSNVQTSSRHRATVIEHTLVNDSVLRLRLAADIDWFPGQYLTIWKDEIVGRPYSIASLWHENFLEFHIKLHEQGLVSQWLYQNLQCGDCVEISEARGNCFYHNSMQSKPLLLIGAGTGLAPLFGIAREALAQSHPARIDLLLTNSQLNQTYMHDELRQLAKVHPNFFFESILKDETVEGFTHVDILSLLKQQYPSLQHWCVFICGAPQLVQALQKQCFLRGASLANIFSDPFITSPPSTNN